MKEFVALHSFLLSDGAVIDHLFSGVVRIFSSFDSMEGGVMKGFRFRAISGLSRRSLHTRCMYTYTYMRKTATKRSPPGMKGAKNKGQLDQLLSVNGAVVVIPPFLVSFYFCPPPFRSSTTAVS